MRSFHSLRVEETPYFFLIAQAKLCCCSQCIPVQSNVRLNGWKERGSNNRKSSPWCLRNCVTFDRHSTWCARRPNRAQRCPKASEPIRFVHWRLWNEPEAWTRTDPAGTLFHPALPWGASECQINKWKTLWCYIVWWTWTNDIKSPVDGRGMYCAK